MKGVEFGEVRDAITRAFNSDEFDMFLFERFDFDRSINVAGGPFRVVVTNVLKQAMQEGWDPILIAEVAAERPFKADVQEVYRKYAQSLVDESRRQVVDVNRMKAIEKYGLSPKIALQKAGVAQLPAATTPGEGFERTIKRYLPMLDVATWRMQLFRMERCVCRIEVATGEMGTGFLVGPDAVLTNYHVLRSVIEKESPANEVRFRFDYYVQPNGVESPGLLAELHPSEWQIDFSRYTAGEKKGLPEESLPTLDELDYALVKVARPLGIEPLGDGTEGTAPRGWIPIPTVAPAITPHMPIFILEHPNSGPLKLAMDTEGVLNVNANATRVRYSTNTERGSSGSPCFDIKWNLVALHHYGDPAFSHPEYNQGIPIDAIRKRLQSQGKSAALGGTSPA